MGTQFKKERLIKILIPVFQLHFLEAYANFCDVTPFEPNKHSSLIKNCPNLYDFITKQQEEDKTLTISNLHEDSAQKVLEKYTIADVKQSRGHKFANVLVVRSRFDAILNLYRNMHFKLGGNKNDQSTVDEKRITFYGHIKFFKKMMNSENCSVTRVKWNCTNYDKFDRSEKITFPIIKFNTEFDKNHHPSVHICLNEYVNQLKHVLYKEHGEGCFERGIFQELIESDQKDDNSSGKNEKSDTEDGHNTDMEADSKDDKDEEEGEVVFIKSKKSDIANILQQLSSVTDNDPMVGMTDIGQCQQVVTDLQKVAAGVKRSIEVMMMKTEKTPKKE